jgi:chorismate synthase
MPDPEAAKNAAAYLDDIRRNRDSIGSVVECVVNGLPVGIGEPVFNKLDANLAKAIMSIGAVKAVEIGDGVLASKTSGLNNNDGFICEAGKISKATNHSGGTLGGLSDGAALKLTAHFKATPSIAAEQHTVNKSNENIEISIKGRHDPIIGPRAVVVVESMAAITILDLLFDNMSSRMDKLIDFYK